MGAYSRLFVLLAAAQSAATLGLVQPTRERHLETPAQGPGSGTTPRFGATGLSEWLKAPSSLDRRATTCVNGANNCFDDPTQACTRCGACCANGRCAADFGSCCPDNSTTCAYGYVCCAGASGPSKCCHAGTSFCCPTAGGCCMNGQTCGKNGCEGTASFVVQSVTTTTTLYTTNYTATITTTSTAFSTLLQTSVQLLTANVTSGGVATATSTVYVKSTRFIKRAVPGLATPSAAPAVVQNGGPPARSESSEPRLLTAAPASPASAAIHDGLAAMGLVRKRTVTSIVYTYSFVWVGVPGATTITKLMVLPTTSLVNSTSTVTNTIFSDASFTVTVTSTITVDVAAATTVSAVLETTLQATAASSDRIKAPDPTATTSGTSPSVGAAATDAPEGNGFGSTSQGTSPTGGDGGPRSSGDGARGNRATESALPVAAPLPELGTAAKAWIGAGAAVAGLAFLGIALMLIHRRRVNTSYGSTSAAGLVIGSPKPMTSTEAGPPYGTGSSAAKNDGSWMLPVQLPPPPPPPPPPPVPPRHPGNVPGGFPAWLTEAAASTSAISLAGLARHVSDVGGANARQSAYSVSDYGASYDPGTALPPPSPLSGGARPGTGDLGPRRWTVEMDSIESLGDSQHTLGAGPVYDPARYMEAPAGGSRELLEAPGQSRPLLGSYGR